MQVLLWFPPHIRYKKIEPHYTVMKFRFREAKKGDVISLFIL